MSFINFKSKISEEGCGKWLTTKGKTNPKNSVKQNKKQPLKEKPCFIASTSKSCIMGTFTPITPPFLPDKCCKMKQTKLNKFLVVQPKQSNNSVTCTTHSSTSNVPVAFPMKREMSLALNEYGK